MEDRKNSIYNHITIAFAIMLIIDFFGFFDIFVNTFFFNKFSSHKYSISVFVDYVWCLWNDADIIFMVLLHVAVRVLSVGVILCAIIFSAQKNKDNLCKSIKAVAIFHGITLLFYVYLRNSEWRYFRGFSFDYYVSFVLLIYAYFQFKSIGTYVFQDNDGNYRDVE